MNVSNCKGCGRLYNVMGTERLCPECMRQLEEKFQKVKAFLNEHPNSPIDIVSEENDVSVKQIRQWVREERLAFAEGSAVGIECESCGKMILTGRYCDSCRGKIANNLMSALERPKPQETKKAVHDRDRMRFL